MKKMTIISLLMVITMLFIGCSEESISSSQSTPESLLTKASVEESGEPEKLTDLNDNRSGKITIYLVRHGKTFFNTTGQVQGWADSPLTEKGIEQAVAVGRGLKDISFTTAFSSDLGRQRATAKEILAVNNHKAPELIELIGLREWFYGGFEGKTNAEMWIPIFEAHGLTFDEEWSQYAELTKLIDDEEIANTIAANDQSGMAESYQEIVKRTLDAVEQMIDLTQQAGGGNVLAVSSGGEIPTILELLVPGQYQGEDISNCSVTILTYKKGVFILETCGDTSYLEAGLQ